MSYEIERAVSNLEIEVLKANNNIRRLVAERDRLLKVAEAAQKSLDQLSYILEVAHNEQHDEVLYPNMLSECATRREELRKALYELEAQ